MILECVTVCVNYSDFLCWTLPFNKQHFNKMVVVTTPDDKKTQKLCEYWHVQCVITNACYEGGGSFNKGKMINEGLKHLGQKDWVLHLDADIFLPPQFSNIVRNIKLDVESLYHVDRMMCDDFSEWMKYFYQPKMQQEADIFVHLRPFRMGVRISKNSYGGWLPIGYFQMWNQGYHKYDYPTQHTSAARGDVQFTLKFPRDKRQMLPEIVGIHLETKIPGDKMGSNWSGRRTPMFGHEEWNEPVVLESDFNVKED